MSDYLRDGEQRARELDNRGPIRFDDNGEIHPEILDQYWRYGFYVFENVFGEDETAWRPGGLQQIALHRRSGRLYAVMHRGGLRRGSTTA